MRTLAVFSLLLFAHGSNAHDAARPRRIAAPAGLAQQASLSGVVFVDRNTNGVRDSGERGLAGVVVSNQADVVATDSTGAFRLDPGTTGIVFVSVPDGYRSVGPFWRDARAQNGPLAFALQPVARTTTFSFVHASDTHIAPNTRDRTVRFRKLVDSLHPAFALVAGDLVRDAMSQKEEAARGYYDLFAAEAKQFTTPLWLVPGNHEHFGVIPARSGVKPTHPLYNRGMYRAYFGPDYYSFNQGGIHFVGLNTVSLDDSAYYGNVDSVQIAWLTRDVAMAPAGMPVVTFNHIPLLSAWYMLAGYLDEPIVGSIAHAGGKPSFRHTVNNTLEVMGAMHGHPYLLALGAHNHVGERLTFQMDGVMTRFEQSAAIVGPTGDDTWHFPSGFTLYTVRNGKIDAGRFIPLDPPAEHRP